MVTDISTGLHLLNTSNLCIRKEAIRSSIMEEKLLRKRKLISILDKDILIGEEDIA